MDTPFWIVWSPQSNQPPKSKFSTLKQAKKVAAYLKKTFPEQNFYILQMVEEVFLED